MIKLTITGNPISVNKLYRGRRFLTDEGEAIKADYYYQAREQYRGKPLAKRLNLSLETYFGSKRIRDIDNIAKALIDSLKGLVWEDDSQIDELHIFRRYDKKNPRVEITIKEL
jgi:Holliday junction resolvase RusA-like endonuclease